MCSCPPSCARVSLAGVSHRWNAFLDSGRRLGPDPHEHQRSDRSSAKLNWSPPKPLSPWPEPGCLAQLLTGYRITQGWVHFHVRCEVVHTWHARAAVNVRRRGRTGCTACRQLPAEEAKMNQLNADILKHVAPRVGGQK